MNTKFLFASLAAFVLVAGAGCVTETPPSTTTTPDYGTDETSTDYVPITPETSTIPGTTTDGMQNPPMTSATSSVIENIAKTSDLLTFGAALQSAGWVERLQGTGEYTLFAPTNDALNRLPSSTVNLILGSQNRQNLTNLLTFHIVAGKYPPDMLMNNQTLTTVNGEKITISSSGGVMSVNSATIEPDPIVSRNGIVYTIGSVLFPKNFRGTPTTTAE